MLKLLLLAGLCISVAAFAQSDNKNLQNADIDANKLDPASKARVRVEGAAGGTRARISEEASGGARGGSGSQHPHATLQNDPGARKSQGPPATHRPAPPGARAPQPLRTSGT